MSGHASAPAIDNFPRIVIDVWLEAEDFRNLLSGDVRERTRPAASDHIGFLEFHYHCLR